MPRPKKAEKTLCYLSNMCANHKYLCCNFCTNKTCVYRCKDAAKSCKYLTDIDPGAQQPVYDARPIDEDALKPKKSKATKEKEWIAENASLKTSNKKTKEEQ